MNTSNRILPLTRVVSLLVLPFLWLAFLILYFYPDLSGERFAWAIQPSLTAMYMGAGYLGGSWLFVNTLLGKRWDRVRGGFLPVTAFTWFMMLATFLHWDRFSHGRLGFTLWLILYLVTPLLVPAIWLRNHKMDSGEPEQNDVRIAPAIRWILRLIAIAAVTFAVVGFISPNFAIGTWPWVLTPLTARVMCGWVALLGVGALTMSNEMRWSGWKVPLESIAIWHVLVFVAAFINRADFKDSLFNWYTFSVGVMLLGIFVFYPLMEWRSRKINSLRMEV